MFQKGFEAKGFSMRDAIDLTVFYTKTFGATVFGYFGPATMVFLAIVSAGFLANNALSVTFTRTIAAF